MTPLSQQSVLGDFPRWLTHVHLLSSCYQSLFHSKVIHARDPGCIFGTNSTGSAVKHSASLGWDPTSPLLASTATIGTQENKTECGPGQWERERKKRNVAFVKVCFLHVGYYQENWKEWSDTVHPPHFPFIQIKHWISVIFQSQESILQLPSAPVNLLSQSSRLTKNRIPVFTATTVSL